MSHERNRAKLEAAEQALAERRLRESSVLNWVTLNLDLQHPCVHVVCKTVETALQSGDMPDVVRLRRELDTLQLKERQRHAREFQLGGIERADPASR